MVHNRVTLPVGSPFSSSCRLLQICTFPIIIPYFPDTFPLRISTRKCKSNCSYIHIGCYNRITIAIHLDTNYVAVSFPLYHFNSFSPSVLFEPSGTERAGLVSILRYHTQTKDGPNLYFRGGLLLTSDVIVRV